jgi:hypothetical protein
MNPVLKKIIIVPFITPKTRWETSHLCKWRERLDMVDRYCTWNAHESTDKVWLYFQKARVFLSFRKRPDRLWIHLASHSLHTEGAFQGKKAVEM